MIKLISGLIKHASQNMTNKIAKVAYRFGSEFGIHHHMWNSWRYIHELAGFNRELKTNQGDFIFPKYSIPSEEYLTPEIKVLNDLIENTRSNDVFYDIGADSGLYTVPVGSVCNTIAFEPHPVRRATLRRVLKRNRVSATVRTEALSNEKRTAKFGYRIAADSKDNSDFTAQLVPGDELVGELPQPTVLKIDVEGAEQDVLSGLDDTIKSKDCRLIYVELHDRISDYGGSWEGLKEHLTSSGFEIETIAIRSEDNVTQPYIKASKIVE